MKKQIEALKMAIKVMEFWVDVSDDDLKKAHDACKEALAHAEEKQKRFDALYNLTKKSQEMGGYD